jgi:intraflagellar transport protein 172
MAAAKQIAYLWARNLGGEAAIKLLSKLGLLDAAIDFAAENSHFEFAFELAAASDPVKVQAVYYKHALVMEDEGNFKDAERSFVQAGRPREAILMHIHAENWDAAQTVAEAYDPASVYEILVGQAKVLFNQKDYAKTETLLLRAQKPDIAIKLYRDAQMWREAIRFAKEYLPARVSELHEDYDRFMAAKPDAGKTEILASARAYEQQRDFNKAIDFYLKLSTDQISNVDQLQESWTRAVELSIKVR